MVSRFLFLMTTYVYIKLTGLLQVVGILMNPNYAQDNNHLK